MMSENETKATERRVTALREQFSVKQTTNKDIFYGFEIESVSDAYKSTAIKRLNREIQKEKRKMRTYQH